MPPQVFQVLRCYKCEVFQVHQVKKSYKWECKMCGEKQSLKRNYGMGNAKECRGHVQRLNNIRGEGDESKNVYSEDEESDESPTPVTYKYKKPNYKLKRSKWNDFVDESESIEPQVLEDNNINSDDIEVVLDIPKKPRKRFRVKYNSEAGDNEVHIKEKVYEETKEIVKLELLENEVKLKPLQQNVVKPSSKWAQFIDEEKQVNTKTTAEARKIKSGFSIFEDDDYDSILDI